MSDGRYLLVVSITQGRNFPAKNGKRLVVDGKFNEELLSSDPVQHSPAPQINTGLYAVREKARQKADGNEWLSLELAWELDKKALHHHKMQRSPIKFSFRNFFLDFSVFNYFIILFLNQIKSQYAGENTNS